MKEIQWLFLGMLICVQIGFVCWILYLLLKIRRQRKQIRILLHDKGILTVRASIWDDVAKEKGNRET